MGHRYKVREIAQQSGLSEATVDRVLHERPGVREDTRAEVRQAISDLDKQRSQLRLSGRKFFFDVVMQAPERFCEQVRAAFEYELPMLSPAVVRCRFHFRETESVPAMLDTLARIRSNSSHGIILKASDHPDVVDAVDAAVRAGIPVVTLVSDVPTSTRTAYVGMDNRAAGATAAYLVDQWLGDSPAEVLITLSHNSFRGEEEREMGFRRALRSTTDGAVRGVVDIARSSGLDETVEDLVYASLEAHPNIAAVYSIGGGNTATVRAFDRMQRPCRVFIAHDLDADNRRLLADGAVSAVLHHDLRADARLACRLLMQSAGALQRVVNEPSPVHVVTPWNTP